MNCIHNSRFINVHHLRCASYDKLFIEDLGKTYYYQDLGCLNEALEEIGDKVSRVAIGFKRKASKIPSTNCGPHANDTLYNVKVATMEVYEFCFNDHVGKSLWTRYVIKPSSSPPPSDPRKDFTAEGLDSTASIHYKDRYTQVLVPIYFILVENLFASCM